MTVSRTVPPASRYYAATRRNYTREWLLIAVYAVVTIGLFINARSFWVDEAVSLEIASQSYPAMAVTVRHIDAVHALYYGILHLWMVFGHSAIVLRSLSAVFALATLPVVASLARKFFGAEVAPAAAAVLATSVFFIFHAQDARSVSLTMLACAGASWSFARAVNDGRVADFALFALGAIVAVYTNVLTIFFFAALMLSLSVMQPGAKRVAAFAVADLIVALACVPLVLLIRMNSTAQIDWIARSTPSQTVHFFLSILGGDGGIGKVGFLTGCAEALVVIGLMTVGVAANLRQLDRSNAIVLSIWFVVPLAMGVLVDRFVHPILLARYFSFELIPAAVLAGAGLTVIGRRIAPALPLAVLCCLAIASFVNVMTIQRDDWRAAAAYVTGESRSSDAIVVWKPQLVLPLEFAMDESGKRASARIFYPPDSHLTPDRFPIATPEVGAQLPLTYRTVWLVASNTKSRGVEAGPFAQLAARYPNVSQRLFPGVAVIRFSR